MKRKSNKIKNYWDNQPVIIRAKFTSICAETNIGIKKNEICLYMPTNKKIYSSTSNAYHSYTKQINDEILEQNYCR